MQALYFRFFGKSGRLDDFCRFSSIKLGQYLSSCSRPRLILHRVRRKSIRYGDLGNGKIRVDFAWRGEKVDFCGNFEVGGHKKGGVFKLIYSASRGIRVLAPRYGKSDFFRDPISFLCPGQPSDSGLFYCRCKTPCVKRVCKRCPSQPNSLESLSG